MNDWLAITLVFNLQGNILNYQKHIKSSIITITENIILTWKVIKFTENVMSMKLWIQFSCCPWNLAAVQLLEDCMSANSKSTSNILQPYINARAQTVENSQVAYPWSSEDPSRALRASAAALRHPAMIVCGCNFWVVMSCSASCNHQEKADMIHNEVSLLKY